MKQLTEKQQAFVANKAAGLANRDAAVAAGYAVAAADVTAAKLMRRPDIKAAIKAERKGDGVKITATPANTMPKKHYADSMTFLMDAMNHTGLPFALRFDAAKALLPYQHARMGEQGKKEKAKERADAIAGRPKFSPKQPPQLRVVTSNEP